MKPHEKALYEKTVARLARCGVKDPTAQIVSLAKEINDYRGTIEYLQNVITDQAEETEQHRPNVSRYLKHLPPYIEVRPTCSECGAPLPIPSICYERENLGAAGMGYVARITPNICPECGVIFRHITFQAELPTEEAQP